MILVPGTARDNIGKERTMYLQRIQLLVQPRLFGRAVEDGDKIEDSKRNNYQAERSPSECRWESPAAGCGSGSRFEGQGFRVQGLGSRQVLGAGWVPGRVGSLAPG
jgi:hypothetical protein